MNKPVSALLLPLLLLVSCGVFAQTADDVTIRVLELNEQTPESVMNRIHLPDPDPDAIHQPYRNLQRDHSSEADGVITRHTPANEGDAEPPLSMEDGLGLAEDLQMEQQQSMQQQQQDLHSEFNDNGFDRPGQPGGDRGNGGAH